MDTLSAELLLAIALYLDLPDLLSWIRTAKRYHAVVINEVYSKAVKWDKRSRDHPTFILRAALRNQVDAFSGLLQHTKDLSAANIFVSFIYCPHPWETGHRCYPPAAKTSLLHVLCHFGRVELARLALAKGADPNGRDSQGRTPLHVAIASGRAELAIIKLLIDAGADVNAQKEPECRELQTALQIAVSEGSLAIVESLLEADADAGVRTTALPPGSPGPGTSVLSLAARSGNAGIVQCIIDKTNPAAPLLAEALVGAAESNDTAAAQLLLDSAAPMTWQTILMAAARSHLPMMKFLIKAGADICAQDDEGRNLLWFVDSHRAAEILLKKFPGLVAARVASGQTCLDCHLDRYEEGDRNGHALVAKLLEYGCDFDPSSKGAKLALRCAAKNMDVQIVSRMLARHPSLVPAGLKSGMKRCAALVPPFNRDSQRKDDEE
jgi:ankyrin repeat protein